MWCRCQQERDKNRPLRVMRAARMKRARLCRKPLIGFGVMGGIPLGEAECSEDTRALEGVGENRCEAGGHGLLGVGIGDQIVADFQH